jgi:hypothetical protein
MGLLPRDFWNLTLSEFVIMASGWSRRRVDEWRHTRMIVSALIGGSKARQALPLPGDFDDIPIRTKEDTREIAKRFGVYEKWIAENPAIFN